MNLNVFIKFFPVKEEINMLKKSWYIKTVALTLAVVAFALYLIITELPSFEKQTAIQSSLSYTSSSN
jgi:hypothetical protein